MPAHRYSQVLQLDIQGTPQAWISLEQAATHVARGAVAWAEGQGPLAVLRGGFNVPRGAPSVLAVPPIIALHGAPSVNLFDIVPAVVKGKLLRRDRHTCAYCAQVWPERDLQCEHIVPASRGGAWSWMNLVTACPLSPPRNSQVRRVSECPSLGHERRCRSGTRRHHQFRLRVHRGA